MCLTNDMKKRPDAKQLMKHPWIINFQESSEFLQMTEEEKEEEYVKIKEGMASMSKMTNFQLTMVTYMNNLNFNA